MIMLTLLLLLFLLGGEVHRGVSLPLLRLELPIDSKALLHDYWINATFYHKFLREALGNQNIQIEQWASSDGNTNKKCHRNNYFNSPLKRTVESEHPVLHQYSSWSRLLGGSLPQFAKSNRNQVIHFLPYRSDFVLQEKAFFSEFPFADHMEVSMTWKFCSKPEATTNSKPSNCVEVIVDMETAFSREAWYNQLIALHTRNELKSVIELWSDRITQQHLAHVAAQLHSGPDKRCDSFEYFFAQ